MCFLLGVGISSARPKISAVGKQLSLGIQTTFDKLVSDSRPSRKQEVSRYENGSTPLFIPLRLSCEHYAKVHICTSLDADLIVQYYLLLVRYKESYKSPRLLRTAAA